MHPEEDILITGNGSSSISSSRSISSSSRRSSM